VVAQTSYGIVDLNLVTNQAELNIKSTEDGRILQKLNLNFQD
jgi:alkaline phosphatase D